MGEAKLRSDLAVLTLRVCDDWVEDSGYGIFCGCFGSDTMKGWKTKLAGMLFLTTSLISYFMFCKSHKHALNVELNWLSEETLKE